MYSYCLNIIETFLINLTISHLGYASYYQSKLSLALLCYGPRWKKNKINETEIVEVEGILLRPSPLEISGIITGIPRETCPNLSLPSPRLIASKSNVDLQREYSCQQISEIFKDVKLYRKVFDFIFYFNHCFIFVSGMYTSLYHFRLRI